MTLPCMSGDAKGAAVTKDAKETPASIAFYDAFLYLAESGIPELRWTGRPDKHNASGVG